MPEASQPVITDAHGRPLGTVGHGMVPLWEPAKEANTDGEARVFVDAGIVHLLRDLNKRGFITQWSCQGPDSHGHGYVSFQNLADLPAVADRLHELLSDAPDMAERFGWGPDPSASSCDWSVHTHRTKGEWGFSVYLPVSWLAVIENAARSRLVVPCDAPRRLSPGI